MAPAARQLAILRDKSGSATGPSATQRRHALERLLAECKLVELSPALSADVVGVVEDIFAAAPADAWSAPFDSLAEARPEHWRAFELAVNLARWPSCAEALAKSSLIRFFESHCDEVDTYLGMGSTMALACVKANDPELSIKAPKVNVGRLVDALSTAVRGSNIARLHGLVLDANNGTLALHGMCLFPALWATLRAETAPSLLLHVLENNLSAQVCEHAEKALMELCKDCANMEAARVLRIGHDLTRFPVLQSLLDTPPIPGKVLVMDVMRPLDSQEFLVTSDTSVGEIVKRVAEQCHFQVKHVFVLGKPVQQWSTRLGAFMDVSGEVKIFAYHALTSSLVYTIQSRSSPFKQQQQASKGLKDVLLKVSADDLSQASGGGGLGGGGNSESNSQIDDALSLERTVTPPSAPRTPPLPSSYQSPIRVASPPPPPPVFATQLSASSSPMAKPAPFIRDTFAPAASKDAPPHSQSVRVKCYRLLKSGDFIEIDMNVATVGDVLERLGDVGMVVAHEESFIERLPSKTTLEALGIAEGANLYAFPEVVAISGLSVKARLGRAERRLRERVTTAQMMHNDETLLACLSRVHESSAHNSDVVKRELRGAMELQMRSSQSLYRSIVGEEWNTDADDAMARLYRTRDETLTRMLGDPFPRGNGHLHHNHQTPLPQYRPGQVNPPPLPPAVAAAAARGARGGGGGGINQQRHAHGQHPPDRHPDNEHAGVAAAVAADPQRAGRRRDALLVIDVGLIFKLAILVALLGHGAGRREFFVILALAVVYYFVATMNINNPLAWLFPNDVFGRIPAPDPARPRDGPWEFFKWIVLTFFLSVYPEWHVLGPEG